MKLRRFMSIELFPHALLPGPPDVSADRGDYTVHVVVGVDPNNRMFLLDLWRQQASSNVWIDAFCDLVIKWKPQFWAEEKTQITSGVGPFISSRAIERRAYTNREQFPTRGDKGIRAQSIRGRMELMGLHVPAGAEWLPDLRAELLAFPHGKHDDIVDALGLCGQLMDKFAPGHVPISLKPSLNARDKAYVPYDTWNGDPNYDAFMLKTL
jgi:predicted phage terminase large subunit-like protein